MNNFSLQNKKVLLIMPIFYDYHNLIKHQLIDYGATVSFYPERKINYLFTFYNNFNQKLLRNYQEKHYNSILKEVDNNKFDYLFVIRGFMLPEFFLEKIKKINPNIKMIMSQWDAERENPYFHLINSFDKVFSFDYEDCKQNQKLIHRPLFFSKDVEKFKQDNQKIIYDYFFMGAYIPERYNAILKFKNFIKDRNLSAKLFVYIPFTTYVKEKIKGKKLDMEILSTTPLDRNTYLKLLSSSKVMVDVSNENQTGLAMRVIEAVGAEKKIVTSNKFIINEKFYNESTVQLFSLKDFSLDESFLKSKKVNEVDVNYYSLKNWVKEHFLDLD